MCVWIHCKKKLYMTGILGHIQPFTRHGLICYVSKKNSINSLSMQKKSYMVCTLKPCKFFLQCTKNCYVSAIKIIKKIVSHNNQQNVKEKNIQQCNKSFLIKSLYLYGFYSKLNKKGYFLCSKFQHGYFGTRTIVA